MHLRMCCMHRNGLAGVIVTDSATERTKGGILEMPSVTEREADMQNKYGRRVAASGSFGGSGIGARESSVISHSPRWQTRKGNMFWQVLLPLRQRHRAKNTDEEFWFKGRRHFSANEYCCCCCTERGRLKLSEASPAEPRGQCTAFPPFAKGQIPQ